MFGGILFLALGVVDVVWLNFRIAPAAFSQPQKPVTIMKVHGYAGDRLSTIGRNNGALGKGQDDGRPQVETDESRSPSSMPGCIPNAPKSPAPTAGRMGARVPDREDRILFKTKLFFTTAHYRLTPKAIQRLDEVLAVLQQHPETMVLIEGHADQRGRSDFNNRLSQKRAMAVVSFLQGRGIGVYRITSSFFGASRPVDPGNTPQAWARNRRAEIHIQKRE